MKYTLRQIAIFLAIAQNRTVAQAAAQLHMSQSAASDALLNLEHHYGVQLFERRGKRLLLSAMGHTVRREALALMQQARTLDTLLMRHEEVGHIRVAASFTIGNYLATRVMAGYLRRYPQADIALNVGNSPQVAEQVLNDEADVGMIEAELQHRDLALLPWREDELVVFCSAQHPLARKPSLTLQDIRQAAWILREPGSGARHTFDRVMAPLLPQMNIYMQLKHNEAIKNAVEAGLGVGCLSEIVLRNNFASGDLVPLRLPQRNMRRKFYFVLPRSKPVATCVEHWMEDCRNLDQDVSVARVPQESARPGPS